MPLTATKLASPGLVTDRATFAWLCDVFVNPARAENLVHVKRPGDIR
jgi:hypothetical protein